MNEQEIITQLRQAIAQAIKAKVLPQEVEHYLANALYILAMQGK